MAGVCEHAPGQDDTACDQSNDCSLGSTCSDGLCEPNPAADGTPCEESNLCTLGTCANGTCEPMPLADGTECGEGAGTCQLGSCVGRFPCTEQGIRDAIAVGGGPHTFDCNGPRTVALAADIKIDNDVILDGEGNLTVDGSEIDVDLGEEHTLFTVEAGVSSELRALAVTGLSREICPCYAIWNDGALKLTDTVLSGNSGALLNRGALAMANCTVSENRDPHKRRYAIENDGGTLTMSNCTVSGNSGWGGVKNWAGKITMSDCTVSGNIGATAFSPSSCGAVRLENSTMSGDLRVYGIDDAASVSVIEGTCSAEGKLVTWTSHGYNIESPGDSCGFDEETDETKITEGQLNLGELADNGGPAMT